MPKLLNDLIEDYKKPFTRNAETKALYDAWAAENPDASKDARAYYKRVELMGHDYYRQRPWSDKDDRLIEMVKRLHVVGFTISLFRHKTDDSYLIRLSPKGIRRIDAIERIVKAIDEDWDQVRFNRSGIYLRGKL